MGGKRERVGLGWGDDRVYRFMALDSACMQFGIQNLTVQRFIKTRRNP